MANERSYLAAWTAPGSDMPKYVNATLVDPKDEDGGVEITVRSPKDLGSVTSVCRIPQAAAEKFITELVLNWLKGSVPTEKWNDIERLVLQRMEKVQ